MEIPNEREERIIINRKVMKNMKSKIISILVGMGIMGVLIGCGQATKTVQAGENGYLKYCGSQKVGGNDIDPNNTKRIEVYEDTEHDKVVYVSIYNGNALDVAVADNTSKAK